MRKWIVCVSVVVALGFVAGSLFAAEGGDKPKYDRPSQVMGVVKSYNAETKELVVTVKKEGEGKDVTFTTTDETKVMSGKDTKALSDLTEGTHVQVGFKKGEGEGAKPIAVIVRIQTTDKPREKHTEHPQ